MLMVLAALGVCGASEARAQDSRSTRDVQGISGISFEESSGFFPSERDMFRDQYQPPFPLTFRTEPERRGFPRIRLPETNLGGRVEFAPGRRLSFKVGLTETPSRGDVLGVSVKIPM